MRDSDLKHFSALLDDTAALLKRDGPLTATQRAMYFRALAAHSLDEVRAALDAHIRDPQRGRFFPAPADVIAQLQGIAATDGRPGQEEAWATALRGADEAETLVWTAEMQQAWSIARPVLDAGDEVGARMAFRECYARLVEEARKARAPVQWTPSLGHDIERRRVALDAAASAGRVSLADVPALPAPRGEVLLLTHASADAVAIPEHARKALRDLADSLASRQQMPSADLLERERTEQLKGESGARVAAWRQGQAA